MLFVNTIIIGWQHGTSIKICCKIYIMVIQCIVIQNNFCITMEGGIEWKINHLR